MKRSVYRILLICSLAIGAAINAFGCRSAPASGTSSKAATVTVDNFAFTPASLAVPVGAEVTWINHDDVPHTITASDKSFTSPALDTDGKFTRVFSQPGSYSYYCAIHPHMTATVIVK